MGEDERSIWRRHIEAVRADKPEEFRRLMEADGVALGQLCHKLNEKERAVFDRIEEYCRRWRTEGGPHRDYARQRNAELEALRNSDPFGDPGPLPQDPAYYSWSELPRWDDSSTKILRGEWAAVLQGNIKEQPVETNGGIAHRLYEALRKEASDDLRSFFREETRMALNELSVQLSDEGRACLQTAESYCDRWEKEGGPHPDTRPIRPSGRDYDPFEQMEEDRRNGYDPFDSSTWRRARRAKGLHALDTWESESTQAWRGTLRGALQPLLASERLPAIVDRDRTESPPATAKPRNAPTSSLPSPQNGRVRRRPKKRSTRGSRPTADAVDATAERTLQVALEAARDAGTNHIPSRIDLAGSVSKELRLDPPITVSALFGTKERAGQREDRHPRLMKLWRLTVAAARDARRQRLDMGQSEDPIPGDA